MKYLCLMYCDWKIFAAMSARQQADFDRDTWSYDLALKHNGQLLAAQALQPTENATTLRIRQGKQLITDGPFAETKEQLGGFILIEATDLNEALRIAAKSPFATIGSIEIRPLMDRPDPMEAETAPPLP